MKCLQFCAVTWLYSGTMWPASCVRSLAILYEACKASAYIRSSIFEEREEEFVVLNHNATPGLDWLPPLSEPWHVISLLISGVMCAPTRIKWIKQGTYTVLFPNAHATSNIRRFYVSQLSVDCPGIGREGPRTIAHHEHPACTYAHSEWIHESSGGARPDSRERGERNVVEWDFGKHDVEFMRSRGWLD